MFFSRLRLRRISWLALLAMAALVLLPTLSHAYARPGNSYTEVCTPLGMKLVALADGEERPSAALLHLEHCPFCGAAFAAIGMPPPPLALPAAPATRRVLPRLFLQAPSTLYAWAAAQPRGPPLLS